MRSRVVRSRGVRWPEVPARVYKDDPALYRDVVRWTLLGDERADAALAFQVRYFELAPGGWSTLERHDHPHAVVVLAGRGSVRLGDERHDLAPCDAVYVAPGDPHQFRAYRGEPLGFL
jgi:quercetin dioxygenase-like cupin family protein